MGWLLDRTFGERPRASRIVHLISILKRTATFGQSANGEREICFAALPGSTKIIPEQIAQAIERRGQQEQTK
jgi:hypothetical protein